MIPKIIMENILFLVVLGLEAQHVEALKYQITNLLLLLYNIWSKSSERKAKQDFWSSDIVSNSGFDPFKVLDYVVV